METLDQLARWLNDRREAARSGAEKGLLDPSVASGRSSAFAEAHEKVMLMIQLEAVQEQAPSVESTLPVAEVMKRMGHADAMSPKTVGDLVGGDPHLSGEDVAETLAHLSAEGRLALSVDPISHVEYWSVVS